MRLLHTSDWHVGKTVRGRSRSEEHQAVLAEIAGVADAEAVDVVLVVGDLFDTAAPTPESERIVYRALLDLSRGGRPVVVVSGNHDNPRRLQAVAPVFESGGVHVQSLVTKPDDGGVLQLDIDGTPLNIALLPFVSQRHVVSVEQLMQKEADEHGKAYDDRMRHIVAALCDKFDSSKAVNVVAAHAMVAGGVLGGGERSAHTIFEYSIGSVAFPSSAHYVALGHLHRTQQIAGACPIWYCGSPLQMDFGERRDTKHVMVVEAEPGVPAEVRQIELAAGRRFSTLSGTYDELVARAGETAGDDFLRIVVKGAGRAGLADELRQLYPNCVDVRVEHAIFDGDERSAFEGRSQRSPHDLFVDYLADRDVDDERLVILFDELYDEASGPGSDPVLEAAIEAGTDAS